MHRYIPLALGCLLGVILALLIVEGHCWLAAVLDWIVTRLLED